MRIACFILLSLPILIFSQAPGCPNIQVDDETVDCNNPCVDLTATFLQTGETTNYEVSSIPYAPPYPFTGGTPTFVGTDDVFSPVITIPFDFCFYGNSYNQLVIGANGVLSFDLNLASGFCAWSFSDTIPSSPNTSGPYENAIHGAFLDINPAVGGDINYATLGSAPCRTFVINFNAVPDFGCTNQLITQQIVIYETTNAIEVYIEDKPTCATWNSGNAVIGIQNIGAIQGICPPNRNTGPWSATQEAWRFTPNGNPNYTVEWFDNSGLSQGFGDTLFNVCAQTQDNYTAEITYTNCNGTIVTETATNTIFVNNAAGQIPSLGLIDTIKSCTTNVIVDADNTLDTYLWNTGETTSSITVNQTGNYILEATQGGCDGDDTVFVSIVNADIIENNSVICELDVIDLNIAETNTSINWSTGETTDNITVSPITSTEFWVEVSDGITICKDSIQIDVNPLPIVDIIGVNEICNGDSTIVSLVFSGTPPYTIDLNGNIELYTNNIENFIVSPANTTTYTINYVSDINCQNDTAKTYTLNINPLPEPIIDPVFYEIYPGETIELFGGNYMNYWWFNNADSLLSQNEILIVDSTLTSYLVVEDLNGCIGISENVIVEYIPRVVLHIPNTFTPNGDEHNELFVIIGDQIRSFNMKIINRWGEEVYSTTNIEKHWDGKFNGKPVPEGTYTYLIDIVGEDKRAFIKTGTINVLY